MVTARRPWKKTARYVHPEVNHVGVWGCASMRGRGPPGGLAVARKPVTHAVGCQRVLDTSDPCVWFQAGSQKCDRIRTRKSEAVLWPKGRQPKAVSCVVACTQLFFLRPRTRMIRPDTTNAPAMINSPDNQVPVPASESPEIRSSVAVSSGDAVGSGSSVGGTDSSTSAGVGSSVARGPSTSAGYQVSVAVVVPAVLPPSAVFSGWVLTPSLQVQHCY